MRLAVLLASSILTGCQLAPRAVLTEIEHVSHLSAGPPFGSREEEDSLNQVSILGRWELFGLKVDAGLGYKLRDGGMYGPRCTTTVRVSKEFGL